MRKIALILALAAVGTVSAWADGIVVHSVVHLDERALEQLRTSNPAHYARAQKILAAANHLCRPKVGEVEYARFDAKDISCARSLVKTSNPPKREIYFRLDDTRYEALVVLTDDPPKLVRAAP